MRNFLFLTGCLFCCTLLFGNAQEDKIVKAQEISLEAVKMMDNGFIDESIEMLLESHRLDPESATYPYEVAYGYVLKKDYEQASVLLEDLINHKDVFDKVYQLLGNCYDWLGDSRSAVAIYEKGIDMFPNSGALYLERSVMYMQSNELSAAIRTLEKGVEVEPDHASNYYWLTKLFLENTEEKVWGMIYGELFLFLEPNTDRALEVSGLLYDTYQNGIKITNNKISLNFSRARNVPLNSKIKDLGANALLTQLERAVKLGFGLDVYESGLSLSLIGENKIDMHSLNRIRTRFLDFYFESKYNEKYPIVLFDFQRTIQESGYLEPYNYWVLMNGNMEEFDDWLAEDGHEDMFDNFIAWYNNNGFQLSQENKFLRLSQ